MTDLEIHSLGDARKYREELAGRRADRDPRLTIWRRAKRAALLVMLAVSFLIYHMISVRIEILSLPQIYVTVKIPPPQPKGAHRI